MSRVRALAGRAYAALAFERAAVIYEVLTSHEAWRRDCRDMAELVGGPRVLDLGVGPGTSALEMARADPSRRYVGLDISAAMLRRAARHAREEHVALPLVRADVLALPVRSGAFDAATGHSFLYLLDDAVAALEEVRRVLRPGGRVAFLEPRAGRAELREALRDGARHLVAMAIWRSMSRLHRRYDEATLPALLARAGFVEARAWPALGGQGVMAIAVRPE